MVGKTNVLIVSGRLEMKREVLRSLDGLPLNAYVALSVEQARDALNKYGVNVVLCDERISDGTYHDVLALTAERMPKINFILLMSIGGPDESREARRLGVAEVIHSRFERADIELALIHAIRGQTAMAHAAA